MNDLVFTTRPDNNYKQNPNELKSRWEKDSLWKDFKRDIVAALKKGDDKFLQKTFMQKRFIMKFFANITHDHHMVVVDLRGLTLKNLNVGEHDFSYCCFDYAELDGVVFNKTLFQYSSLNKAKIINSKFINVQSSPISVLASSFINTEFEQGFFMHSDFTGSKLENCQTENSNFDLVLF